VAYQEHVNYQKAVMDYLDYRKYRRNATMSDEEWDYSGKQLELKKAISDSLKIEYQLAQLEAMKKMPINTVWMQKIGVMCNFFTKDKVKWAIKDLYQTRMREINRYPEGKRILALLYPSPKAELGKKAVDGDLMDLQGRTYHLSDFKGKYVLLDFWSTSCGPCIAAIPSMKKFKERHPDMVIVSLCIDQFKYWKTNRHYQNLPWYNLNDGGGQLGLAKSYDANAVPTYILIPAFVINELTVGFEMGVLIFFPFLVIDMVVASTLMAMGMIMLPPVMISLPFKIILFILVDGWSLLTQGLFVSFM
jgi:thiol-disulfide isomerase/thioredoxin